MSLVRETEERASPRTASPERLPLKKAPGFPMDEYMCNRSSSSDSGAELALRVIAAPFLMIGYAVITVVEAVTAAVVAIRDATFCLLLHDHHPVPTLWAGIFYRTIFVAPVRVAARAFHWICDDATRYPNLGLVLGFAFSVACVSATAALGWFALVPSAKRRIAVLLGLAAPGIVAATFRLAQWMFGQILELWRWLFSVG